MVVVEVAVPTGGTHGGQPISAAVYATFATVTNKDEDWQFNFHVARFLGTIFAFVCLKTYCFTPTT